MNLNTDIAIKSYDLIDKLLESAPKYDDKDDNLIYHFHLYLLEFLNQEIVIDENLDGKISENVFSINFGLLCNAAINNLKNNYWIFTPKHCLNTCEIEEEDYTYLREKYVLHLVYKLYGLEAEENFKEMMQYDWVNLLKQYSSSSKGKPGQTRSENERFEANRKSQKIMTLYLFMKPFVMGHTKSSSQTSDKKKSKDFYRKEQDHNHDYSDQTCPTCNGSGKAEVIKNFNDWHTCKRCSGEGVRKLPSLKEGEKHCSACKGEGMVEVIHNFNDWHKCKKCEGSGVEPKKFVK
jgi:DnaJ-class molecular chaperone